MDMVIFIRGFLINFEFKFADLSVSPLSLSLSLYIYIYIFVCFKFSEHVRSYHAIRFLTLS